MADARFTSLTELKRLFDPEIVGKEKIDCIKALRQITGEGLKETKDFFEQVVTPAILNKSPMKTYIGGKTSPIDPTHKEANLKPPMYLVGRAYTQLDKTVVLIVGVSNQNTSYETVYSIDPDGSPIHRYNRRDFGRCTGTDHENPCELNLQKLENYNV